MSSSPPPSKSFRHHSRHSSKQSSPSKEFFRLPTRRLTIDASQIPHQHSPDQTPRQTVVGLLRDRGLTTIPFTDSSLPLLRKTIQTALDDIVVAFNRVVRLGNQIVAFASQLTDLSAPPTLSREFIAALPRATAETYPRDPLRTNYTALLHLTTIDDIADAFTSFHSAATAAVSNSLCPLAAHFPIVDAEKYEKFARELPSTIQKFRTNFKESIALSDLYRELDSPAYDDLLVDLAALLAAALPLLDADRNDVQRRIDSQEILSQFKATTTYQTAISDTIGLSDLLFAKSNVTGASSALAHILKPLDILADFVTAHDLRDALIFSSKDIFPTLDVTINEEDMLFATSTYLYLPTADDLTRHHKAYLFFTTYGIFSFLIYANNTTIPSDYIPLKLLQSADISITSPHDPFFAADLHISYKDTSSVRSSIYAIPHYSQVSQCSQYLKTLLSRSIQPNDNVLTPQNFNQITTSASLKKKDDQKKFKFVGSSVDDLLAAQLSSTILESVPEVITRATIGIIRRGLAANGLFRKSPDEAVLNELLKKLNDSDFRHTTRFSNVDVMTLCGLLKRYLMEMNPRFLPTSSYDVFVDIARQRTTEDTRDQIRKFVSSLDVARLSTLSQYIFLMNNIDLNHRINKMGAQNLSIAICQCFLPPKNNTDVASVENDAFQCLIENYDLLSGSQYPLPRRFPSLLRLFKRQITGEGKLSLVSTSDNVWFVDKSGAALIIKPDTFNTEIISLDHGVADVKHIAHISNHLYIATTSEIFIYDISSKSLLKSLQLPCTSLQSSGDILYVGQVGKLQIIDASSLSVVGDIDALLDTKSDNARAPVAQILVVDDILYIAYYGISQIALYSKTSQHIIGSLHTQHSSTISSLHWCSTSKTIWSGDSDGKISVYSSESTLLLRSYDPPYGGVVGISDIPGYIVVVFISSQVMIFSNETCALISTFKIPYLPSCKSMLIVHPINSPTTSQIWLENDDDGDVCVLDISYPYLEEVTDDGLLRIDYLFENDYVNKTPLGHSFKLVTTTSECAVCHEKIQDADAYECVNCNKVIHPQCVEPFSNMHCVGNSTITEEVINKPKK